MQIAIKYTTPDLLPAAQQLAQELHLPINIEADAFLVLSPQHLALVTHSKFKPIVVDFLSPKFDMRRKNISHRNELIARAVGLKGKAGLTIIDATAGLGQDAFILATLGANVRMLERSPIIGCLLADGLQRLYVQMPHLIDRLTLTIGDARKVLQKLSANNYPEVIYLDPMHPPRAKSALVKKEMRILRQIVGIDEDKIELFNLARTIAKQRVVIKLPIAADCITDLKPSMQFKGVHTRFDVYLTE